LEKVSRQYNHIFENIKKELHDCYLGKKFYIHGDLHLGQAIKTGSEWKILDLEGEPLKTLEERLTFESPIRDIASMICSINYRFRKINAIQNDSKHHMELLNNELIKGYLDTCNINNVGFLPQHQEFELLLAFFRIERTIYECVHEAQCRPDWFFIPYDGLNEILEKHDFDSKILNNEAG
jgi:maltokinase